MTEVEAEAVLKIAGWNFETRDTTNIATQQIVKTRWYAYHESNPKSFRHAMLGFPDKISAIRMAWREHFGERLDIK